MIGFGAFLSSFAGATSLVTADTPERDRHRFVALRLSQTLRSIGNQECLDVASKLEATALSQSPTQLHLRSADLSQSDVLALAKTLNTLPSDNSDRLVSLSLSYNNRVGNEGASALAQSIPSSLEEIGLVGCGIGDAGGEHLLTWAKQSENLKMICFEGNYFSENLKERFASLGHHNGLTVFV